MGYALYLRARRIATLHTRGLFGYPPKRFPGEKCYVQKVETPNPTLCSINAEHHADSCAQGRGVGLLCQISLPLPLAVILSLASAPTASE